MAEEALATGLLCFLLFPDDPLAVIRRAVVSSGDSDSIACLVGASAGAYHGLDAWPKGWAERIEALERFVRHEPLRRVHECVFGMLALESEPVDPRL